SQVMLVHQSDCQKYAQKVLGNMTKKADEDRAKKRRFLLSKRSAFGRITIVSRTNGDTKLRNETGRATSVYYYHQPEHLNFSGTYVHAIPMTIVGGESTSLDIFAD